MLSYLPYFRGRC